MKSYKQYLVDWATRWVEAADAEVECLQKAILGLQKAPTDQKAKNELQYLRSMIAQIRRAYARKKSLAAKRWNVTMPPMKR